MRVEFLSVLAALSVTAAASAQAPVVGYWAFDEASGLVASDFGPYGNHGALSGYGTNGTWVPGRHGNALQFDGVDDYVNLARMGGIPIYKGDGSPFSICFWVKAPAADDDRVYSEGLSTAGTNGGALFTLGSGRTSRNTTDRLQIYVRNDAAVTVMSAETVATVFDDTWHHVAYVDVAGAAKVYVDGILDTRSFDYRVTGSGGSANAGTQTARFGTYTTDRVALGAVLRNNVVAYLQGQIDELWVFTFALQPADIQVLMAHGLPTFCRASIGEFGPGCGTGPFDLAAAGSALIGGPGIQLQMQRGAPGAPVFMCFGFGRIAPIDLALIGLPGCVAYPANLQSVGFGALDASGASAPIAVPVPGVAALACLQVNFQAAALVASVPTIELSDVVLVTLGY